MQTGILISRAHGELLRTKGNVDGATDAACKETSTPDVLCVVDYQTSHEGLRRVL